MTLQQAEAFVRTYQALLADEERRGNRRNPALLPTTKDNLLRAFKLLIAQLYFIGSDTEEQLKPLVSAAMFIDSFNDQHLDATDFIYSMTARRRELDVFHADLRAIARTDAFFWQRVYTLAGISCETKRTTFFQSMREKLGLAPKPEEFHGDITQVSASEDRIRLD
jgi:hypothetical protein